jgi:hypothetical protein
MKPLRIDLAIEVRDRAGLQWALDALTLANVRALRDDPLLPALHSSGVRYARESAMARAGRDVTVATSRGRAERFAGVHRVLELGAGDCDDLAPWRAAELLCAGVPARAVAMPVGATWHVVVLTPWGTEDPSRDLGMGR